MGKFCLVRNENQTKHTSTQCGQTAEFVSKQVVHAVNAGERIVPSVHTLRKGIWEVVPLCKRYSANVGKVSYKLYSEEKGKLHAARVPAFMKIGGPRSQFRKSTTSLPWFRRFRSTTAPYLLSIEVHVILHMELNTRISKHSMPFKFPSWSVVCMRFGNLTNILKIYKYSGTLSCVKGYKVKS